MRHNCGALSRALTLILSLSLPRFLSLPLSLSLPLPVSLSVCLCQSQVPPQEDAGVGGKAREHADTEGQEDLKKWLVYWQAGRKK